MLIDGLRLEGVGDCGEEFALECRECDPDGFTSFDRKLGAIMSEPHRTYMKAPDRRPSLLFCKSYNNTRRTACRMSGVYNGRTCACPSQGLCWKQ